MDSEDTLPPEDRRRLGEMSFLEHLEEARKMLFGCAVAILLGIVIVSVYLEEVIQILQYPLRQAMEGRAQPMEGLVTTGVMSVFSVIFEVAFFGGFLLSLPGVFYFVARFISPALTKREKRKLIPVGAAAIGLFLLGCAFSYFLLVPVSLKVTLELNDLYGMKALWQADKYYGLLVWMVFGVGASFEFPLLVIALERLGFVSIEQLKDFRRYSTVAFLVISAFVTPTADPLTFLLMAVPMIAFYELAILYCRIFKRKTDADNER